MTVNRKVQDLQAILINPKWAEHGFDTFASTTTADSQDSDEKPTGAASHGGQKKPAYTAAMGKKLKPNKADKSDYAEIRSAFSGLKIEQLKKLIIPPEVMKEGILFIWAEKELISEILTHFEAQGFEYVENMVYIMLDPSVKTGK